MTLCRALKIVKPGLYTFYSILQTTVEGVCLILSAAKNQTTANHKKIS